MTSIDRNSAAHLETTNYRQVIATLVPGMILAYVLLLSPLIHSDRAQADFALNKLVFPALFSLMTALYLAERPASSRDTTPGAALLILLLAYCAASAFWAIVPERSLSQLLLLSLCLATIAMACHVSGSLNAIFRVMFLVFVATLAVNLIYVMLTPRSPIGHQGIYPHKNELGAVASLGFLLACYGIGNHRRLFRLIGLAMLPVALFILWQSESKTSMGLALLVPLVAGSFWMMMRYLRIALPVGVALVVLVGVITLPVLSSYGLTLGEISMLVGIDATFTGRTDIWAFAVEEIAKRPAWGHGFNSFWGIGGLSPALRAPPGYVQVTPNGHSGYVDILLELGFVGLAIFSLLLMSIVGGLQNVARHLPVVGFTGLCLLSFLALHNLLETTWLEPLDAGTTLFAVLLFAPLACRPGARS